MATKHAAAIKQVAEIMRDIDFCMFTTTSADGGLYGRPMSNNGEVEFDGDIWFFSGADTRKIQEIKADPRVHLSYVDPEQFRFISMTGTAEIVRDRDKKRELWLDELKRWFKDGPDSLDVVLINVRPTLVAYWTGAEDGQIKLD
jgi:general stress protein 26